MLKHVLGSSMGKADSLSRWLDWQKGVEKDNENRTLLKRKWLKVRVIQAAEVIIEGVNLLEEIRKSEANSNKGSKRNETSKSKNAERWRVKRKK